MTPGRIEESTEENMTTPPHHPTYPNLRALTGMKRVRGDVLSLTYKCGEDDESSFTVKLARGEPASCAFARRECATMMKSDAAMSKNADIDSPAWSVHHNRIGLLCHTWALLQLDAAEPFHYRPGDWGSVRE